MVVSDLYLGDAAPLAGVEASWPALARLARYGALTALPQGWRSWLARWLGSEDIAAASPAAVAAAAADSLAPEGSRAVWVWLADPVELRAGLTSVHLTALLRLDAAEQSELCRGFDEIFAETGYRLSPTRCGRFLAVGPFAQGEAERSDPARWLGSSLAGAFAQRRAGESFRRLGAEIEMWLHGHPLNERRARERRPPVSALWMWGGGAPLARANAAARSASSEDGRAQAELFGDDPFVEGLSHLTGARWSPAPLSLASVAPSAERTVIQIELFGTEAQRGRLAARASPIACAAETLEREWIVPGLERLDRRDIERLVVVAGDRQVSLTRRDGWKRWRRRRPALAALAGP
jgi:hypothetical protein